MEATINGVTDSWTTEGLSTEAVVDVIGLVRKSRSRGALRPADIAYLFIGALGLAGNLFVILIIFNSTSMRKVVTTTFIINQSLVDALGGFFLILVVLFDDNSRHYDTLVDEIYCRVWLSRTLLWVMSMVSSLNLMAITLERLIAVWKPLWHRSYFTRSKQVIVLVIIWTVGPTMRFMHGIADSRVKANGRCSAFGAPGKFSEVTGFLMVVCEFALPALVFIVSYTKIAWILHSKRRILQGSIATRSSDNNKVHGGKNIIKTLLLVSCCFLFCWTTNEIYYLLYLLGYKVNFRHPFYDFSVIAVFCNCCCNPFVYILKYKDFQQGIRKFFHCRGASVAPGGSNVTATGPSATAQ